MATQVWQGGAPAVAQVNTWTFAGVWIIGETITVTIGAQAFTYAITSATIATFLPLLQAALAALSASVYPELMEQTWANTATTITATASTPGKPFTCTISTNSAAGTINGGASSAGTATTANAGPQSWATAANWSTGAAPAGGDSVILDREGEWIKYDLDQHTITLASLRCVAKSFRVGLPRQNKDGTAYPEYRPDYLKIGVTSGYLRVNSGTFKVNVGTVQTSFQVDATGSGDVASTPAALFAGTHASNVWLFYGGSIGLAYYAQDSATAATLSASGGATVTCGTGCTLATVNNYGATLQLNSAVGTALNHPSGSSKALTTVYGTGAVAQLTAQGGTIAYNTTGSLGGNTVLGGSTTLSFDGDQRTKTVTNAISCYSSGCAVRDGNGVVTGGGGYVVKWVDCPVGTMGVKSNSQVTVVSL